MKDLFEFNVHTYRGEEVGVELWRVCEDPIFELTVDFLLSVTLQVEEGDLIVGVRW